MHVIGVVRPRIVHRPIHKTMLLQWSTRPARNKYKGQSPPRQNDVHRVMTSSARQHGRVHQNQRSDHPQGQEVHLHQYPAVQTKVVAVVAHELVGVATKYRRHAGRVVRAGEERHAVQRRGEVVADGRVAQGLPGDPALGAGGGTQKDPVGQADGADEAGAVGEVHEPLDAGQVLEGAVVERGLGLTLGAPSLGEVERGVVYDGRGEPQRDAVIRAGQMADVVVHVEVQGGAACNRYIAMYTRADSEVY